MLGAQNPALPSSWDPVWLASTDMLEGQATRGGRVSTCAVFVNRVLKDCGCAESWVFERWIAGSPMRRWPSSRDTKDPGIDQLKPGDVLIWNLGTGLDHTGFFLGQVADGIVLTAEGGQPGGRVKRRSLGSPDIALSLDRLRWLQGEAPTVGTWLESYRLPLGQCRAEDFLPDSELVRMDAGRWKIQI